jgi:hypothetical protein
LISKKKIPKFLTPLKTT